MKPKAAPNSPAMKDTVVSLMPQQGPQVNLMFEAYQDSKLKRTKVCACTSVLIALIIVGGVLGSIALWKYEFPNQDNNRHPYRPNTHLYPPHNTGTHKYPGQNGDTRSSPATELKEDINENEIPDISDNDIPDILKASTVMPSSGSRDDTISIDGGSEKSRFSTEKTITVESQTQASDRTGKEDGDKSNESADESFGGQSFNYEWTSYSGPSSSSISSTGSDYYDYYPEFNGNKDKGNNKKLIPFNPDYESASTSDDEDIDGSGFGNFGSGFGDMETSGDSEDGSGDFSSIDPAMYLPSPAAFSGNHPFPMSETDYSSSVTEISNVLKDPKQEYEFWKYIYDQSDNLVDYIEGAKQKLIRQESSLNVVDQDLPMVQLVRTPQPQKDFKGRCYNLVCSMKTAPDSDNRRWSLTGYAREGARLVHASGNKGKVQITLRRQPMSATSMLHFNSYLLLQFPDVCFISQIESGLPSLPNQRADFPIVETFKSTAQVYSSSGSDFCQGLPVYWAKKVDGYQQMETFGRHDNATPGSASSSLRKEIQMPCCYCKEEPCICSCDML